VTSASDSAGRRLVALLAMRHAEERRAGPAVRSEINVTPLVDVVLVLLIIFMVVTPMIARGVDVRLPVTAHHSKKNDDNRDIIVSIAYEGTNPGSVYVGADRVPLEKLGQTVQEEKRRHPDKGVFLKADERLEYGQARLVMDAIHQAGIEDVQLGTEEEARQP
jgi:biopolymer transport protein TolR